MVGASIAFEWKVVQRRSAVPTLGWLLARHIGNRQAGTAAILIPEGWPRDQRDSTLASGPGVPLCWRTRCFRVV